MSIRGAGPGRTVIDANDVDRIFDIEQNKNAFVDVAITGVTMRDGVSPNQGGALAISDQTAVTLTDTALVSNQAAQYGGAIFVAARGSVSVTRSTLNANRALNGGALASDAGVVEITNSTISGNVAGQTGGGLFLTIFSGGSTMITNTTIAGNRVGAGGAGIAAPGSNGDPSPDPGKRVVERRSRLFRLRDFPGFQHLRRQLLQPGGRGGQAGRRSAHWSASQ
ncbi:MAG: hypothetical protein WEB00_06830 [Dehalococcoidia bacterium]